MTRCRRVILFDESATARARSSVPFSNRRTHSDLNVKPPHSPSAKLGAMSCDSAAAGAPARGPRAHDRSDARNHIDVTAPKAVCSRRSSCSRWLPSRHLPAALRARAWRRSRSWWQSLPSDCNRRLWRPSGGEAGSDGHPGRRACRSNSTCSRWRSWPAVPLSTVAVVIFAGSPL
jgi:hypothetical protein